ncbi:MAG: Holliday junction branch migration protein RuvA [Planctomycetota bacterium]
MIARITGTLVETDPTANAAYVEAGSSGGGLIYEVILPAYAATRLAPREGEPVTLHTLCFFEATAQGATIFPRLAGFPSRADRRFFELFVTVKGIGHRRALRAMVLDPGTLAAAIADRDLKLIQTMPEVGKKLAETIVVTLKDKVDAFVSAATYDAPAQEKAKAADAKPGELTASGGGTLAKDALEILLQLGEPRLDAVQLIDRVLAQDDAPRDPQGVIESVYAIKAAG